MLQAKTSWNEALFKNSSHIVVQAARERDQRKVNWRWQHFVDLHAECWDPLWPIPCGWVSPRRVIRTERVSSGKLYCSSGIHVLQKQTFCKLKGPTFCFLHPRIQSCDHQQHKECTDDSLEARTDWYQWSWEVGNVVDPDGTQSSCAARPTVASFPGVTQHHSHSTDSCSLLRPVGMKGKGTKQTRMEENKNGEKTTNHTFCRYCSWVVGTIRWVAFEAEWTYLPLSWQWCTGLSCRRILCSNLCTSLVSQALLKLKLEMWQEWLHCWT